VSSISIFSQVVKFKILRYLRGTKVPPLNVVQVFRPDRIDRPEALPYLSIPSLDGRG